MLCAVRDYAEPMHLGQRIVVRVPVLAMVQLAMRRSASQ